MCSCETSFGSIFLFEIGASVDGASVELGSSVKMKNCRDGRCHARHDSSDKGGTRFSKFRMLQHLRNEITAGERIHLYPSLEHSDFRTPVEQSSRWLEPVRWFKLLEKQNSAFVCTVACLWCGEFWLLLGRRPPVLLIHG